MTLRKEHWTKSAWTISIGSAIFSLLLTMIYDYSKDKPILTTTIAIFDWLGNLTSVVLNFDLKLWWVIISIFLLISIFVIIEKLKKDVTLKPDFYYYNEDKFKRWTWNWKYEWRSRENAWVICEMKAHCPNCETPMIDYSNRFDLRFECPRCDYSASDEKCDEPHKIERIILDNIDRKIFTNKNNR